jgi:hypothetical protein
VQGVDDGASDPAVWKPNVSFDRIRMTFLSVMVSLFRSFRLYIRDAAGAAEVDGGSKCRWWPLRLSLLVPLTRRCCVCVQWEAG